MKSGMSLVQVLDTAPGSTVVELLLTSVKKGNSFGKGFRIELPRLMPLLQRHLNSRPRLAGYQLTATH